WDLFHRHKDRLFSERSSRSGDRRRRDVRELVGDVRTAQNRFILSDDLLAKNQCGFAAFPRGEKRTCRSFRCDGPLDQSLNVGCDVIHRYRRFLLSRSPLTSATARSTAFATSSGSASLLASQIS